MLIDLLPSNPSPGMIVMNCACAHACTLRMRGNTYMTYIRDVTALQSAARGVSIIQQIAAIAGLKTEMATKRQNLRTAALTHK